MKKKTLNTNKMLLLSSLVLLMTTCLMKSCVCNTNAIQPQTDSPLNEWSSQSYDKFIYQTTDGSLPLEKEVTVYVWSGEAKRMYYRIHNSKPKISVTVTPCESTIEWKLSFLPQKDPNKERKQKYRRRYKRRHNKYLSKQLLNNEKPFLLTKYFGDQRTTYSNLTSSTGFYIIDINSMGRDVRIKIYVSQQYPYPLLPNKHNIDIINIKNNRVLIGWIESPSADTTAIEYCVSVSSKKHFADNCLLDSEPKDMTVEEHKFDTMPSALSSSFSYWWGRTVKNMLKTRLNGIVNHNIRIECIGKKKWHLLKGLDNKRNNIYFIDVFARNVLTNATSMYVTINVTLMTTQPIVLRDGQQIALKLNQTNNFTQLFNYVLSADSKKSQQKLYLFISSCTGFGSIQMTVKSNDKSRQNSSQVLFRQNIFTLKSMELSIDTNNRNTTESLLIEMRSSVGTDKSAVLLMSKTRYPFPLLPQDTKIKVMESLTDCHSVTLAWNASPDDKVLYCIYEREAHNHYSTIEPIGDVCADDQPMTIGDHSIDDNPFRKVLCKRYHKSSKRRFHNKIIQTIDKLSSGQKYVFQIMITKYKGRSLAYEQVWVSTKPKYQCY